MARRTIEVLRDRVIDSARGVVTCPPHAHYSALSALREAFDALDAHIRPISNSPGPASGDNECSFNAALAYCRDGKAATVRQQVADEIWSAMLAGAKGLTDSQLEIRLRKRHETVSSARRWLVINGWVADTGARRDSAAGRPSTVWGLTEPAIQHMRSKM